MIIAGFGRVGQLLARVFDACGVQYVALDVDPVAVAQHRATGMPVYFGDASRVEILRRMHAERAMSNQGTGMCARAALASAHTPQHTH